MAMGAPIRMPTEAEIQLTLAQWFSPGFPVGAFSYSHGLEAAVEMGCVTSADSLRDWLLTILHDGTGRADAIFLSQAFQAESTDAIRQIDATCRAFAPSQERLAETTLQGSAFAKITADVWGGDLPDLCYPVAVGRAAQLANMPLLPTSRMYLHAFASNLVMAATRLMPLGQTAAQSLIRDLAAPCAKLADETQAGDPDHLSNTAYLADVYAMRHETQTSRIFRT